MGYYGHRLVIGCVIAGVLAYVGAEVVLHTTGSLPWALLTALVITWGIAGPFALWATRGRR